MLYGGRGTLQAFGKVGDNEASPISPVKIKA
jgi:hypothetical protein